MFVRSFVAPGVRRLRVTGHIPGAPCHSSPSPHALLDPICATTAHHHPQPAAGPQPRLRRRDRRTVSQALWWWHDAGSGTYNEVWFDPASPESSSHTYTLGVPAQHGPP